MERNKWETALRCLEVALHPNTSDDEVIAGVNGFRRTAGGAPLREVCAFLARTSASAAEPGERQDQLERLNRENLELRRRLELAETIRSVTVRRVEQRLCALGEELAAARLRAAAAERQLLDFGSAHVAVTDDLRQEISILRGALSRVQQNAARPQHVGSATMFRDLLAAAQRGGEAGRAASYAAKMPDRGHDAANSNASFRVPWTA
jgi:hypothetical protein